MESRYGLSNIKKSRDERRRSALAEGFRIKFVDFRERNDSHLIVQIGMGGAWNNQKLLVLPFEMRVRFFGIGQEMRLFSMDQKDRGFNFINIRIEPHIQKGSCTGHVPAVGTVAGTGMTASRRLAVVVIILYKRRCICGNGIDDTAAAFLVTVLKSIVLCLAIAARFALRASLESSVSK